MNILAHSSIALLAVTLCAAPPGLSERDLLAAKEEISAEDTARVTSAPRADVKELIAAAPALVARQLQHSREHYGTLEAWQRRRAQLREEFLKGAGLWPLPERTPPRAITHSRREHDGYSVENVAIEAMPGFFCTGNLYRPLARDKNGPAVLCPHGHFRPMGRFREEHQIRCAHLARMGATVFSYSMVGWNDSRQTTHRDPLVLALQTLNSLAALDYLCGLPGVDPARVGATGASGGGSQAFFLALIDERVAATCPVGIVYPWTAPLGCLCEGGMPVMQAAESNAIELSAAIAPRAQLFISLGGDLTRDFPQVGFPFVRDIYRLHGREDAVQNVHLPDELHDFGPSKRRAMYEFFARHLAMKLLPENAGTITIERPRQMEVFNDAHPLPAHGLQGNEEIAKAFAKLPRSGKATPLPEGMALVPAGAFEMGNDREALTGARPVHRVQVDAFFMDRREVSIELWQAVQKWSASRGYSIRVGIAKAPAHPVHSISWHDAAKWCNARSQQEGLTPCYYTDDAHTALYRAGEVKITRAQVKWDADGYRLPTEAEWEKAARGGIRGAVYPWGDTIHAGQANYAASGDPFEQGKPPHTAPVGYFSGAQRPAGGDMANGFGLYDMAGNLWEWCWDWRDDAYYSDAAAGENPRGPQSGQHRILRGGSWDDPPPVLHVAYRGGYTPSNFDHLLGVRCVRRFSAALK